MAVLDALTLTVKDNKVYIEVKRTQQICALVSFAEAELTAAVALTFFFLLFFFFLFFGQRFACSCKACGTDVADCMVGYAWSARSEGVSLKRIGYA